MTSHNYTVYIHINKTNGKAYVGITGMPVKSRWGKEGHGYVDNEHFYRAIEKYGWNGFIHIVFRSQLSEEEAALMEQHLIASYKADNSSYGYNKSKGGEGGNNQGKNSGTLEYNREHNREYYEAHKTELKVCHREYYEAHKTEIKSYNREYYEAHKTELKVRHREYRAKRKINKQLMKLSDKGIKNYIENVQRTLQERFGNIDPAWEMQLILLEDNLLVYKKLHEAIQNDPDSLSIKDMKVLKEVTNAVLKLSQKFGLTPYDKPRIKLPDKKEKENDYIDSLIG